MTKCNFYDTIKPVIKSVNIQLLQTEEGALSWGPELSMAMEQAKISPQ